MAEITPFHFDAEGTRLLKTLLDAMEPIHRVLKICEDEEIDVTAERQRYENYKRLMERIYEEYRQR